MSTRDITVTVDGTEHSVEVESRRLLVHTLRELGYTGVKIGCDTSLCGACTIEKDGKAVKSCCMFSVQADGAEITTVESLADDEELHPIQESFHEEHGLQCGYCTPGMIMTTKSLLERNDELTDETIREGLEGNLCRCTGYQNIVDAVKLAADKTE